MRTTNLLQSYSNTNPALSQYNSEKAKNNFDIKKELTNRTFIKPLPSNGQLVHNTIFDAPSEFFRDTKYNLKALKDAVKGNANDHQLGRLNDLGMKLGGIAIATYLYAMKKTPLTKIMEFVGVASFFGAMDIWPKLALQLPAYLIHGFDIRQQYRDQFGTKKPVFQDHQFIPWDLYTDEQIYKIGDRLGVPKDIKNRRDFIQEKMRKIALQNNTMWMLTAGFATPIMSALICNSLEKPIANYQDQKIDRNAEKLLSNVNKEAAKYSYKEYLQNFENFLKENKDKPITKKLFNDLTAKISSEQDPITIRSIKRDLDQILIKDGFDFSKKSLDSVREVIKRGFEVMNLPQQDIERIVPSAQDLYNAFSQKGLLEDDVAKEGITDFSEHIKSIYSIMDDKISAYAGGNEDLAQELQSVVDRITHTKRGNEPEIYKALSEVPSSKLTEELTTKLIKVSKVLADFKAKNNVIDRYAWIKAGQAPETILANTWNNISDELLKIFGFTQEEITKVRHDREMVGDLLREKCEKIVANDTVYDSTVKQLNEKLQYLESRTEFSDINKWDKNTNNKYKKEIDTIYNQASKQLEELGMTNTMRRIIGHGDVDPRSLKDLKLSFVIDRVKGVKCSFYRFLNTLDLYKRITNPDNIEKLFDSKMPREYKESLVEMCKQLLIKGHSSDYSVKFYFPMYLDYNPQFNTEEEKAAYYSPIEVKDGKVVNKYLGTHAPSELVDNAHDQRMYNAAMRLMYSEDLDPKTEKIIVNGSSLHKKFAQYRRDIYDFWGGDRYFAKVHHYAYGAKGGGSSELRFLLMGASPDDIFTNLCSQKFNSNKWLKIFGLSGAALLGVTTLSQFFMGHMKKEKGDK